MFYKTFTKITSHILYVPIGCKNRTRMAKLLLSIISEPLDSVLYMRAFLFSYNKTII